MRSVTRVPRDISARRTIVEELNSLLHKNAILQIADSPNLCLSPIFTVPKHSGGRRVILNLKQINLFVPDQHFRMETLAVILPQLSPGDWAVSIDLQDAYLHVLIHPKNLGDC